MCSVCYHSHVAAAVATVQLKNLGLKFAKVCESTARVVEPFKSLDNITAGKKIK